MWPVIATWALGAGRPERVGLGGGGAPGWRVFFVSLEVSRRQRE